MTTIQTDIRDPAGLSMARALFGAEIAVAVTDPRVAHNRVLPQETRALKRMAPIRQRAYSAGRVAVHEATSQLDLPLRPVLMTPDRAPLWPEGLTGSISHSQSCCIAALGRTNQVRALGVDVEEDTDLDSDLVATVCTRAERAWLSAQPNAQAGLLAKLIFSAKECAYKCQYPVSKTLFGFDTFEVTPDPDTGQFEATFLNNVPHFAAGTQLHGRFGIADGLIITAMALRP